MKSLWTPLRMGLMLHPHAVFCVPAAALLLVAVLGEHGRDFYFWLRFCTCVACVVAATASVEGAQSLLIGTAFAAAALLFNPWFPFRLSRGIWIPIDVATAIALLAASWWIYWEPRPMQSG